ncbi:hypothetical protein HQ394_05120 [Defluviicoccus vanus]|uniref:Uncharacterized protein n=2 Tax=Defluviicoccus vanus TaxID=111831 RepID=A0A7H1MZG2_9PROT|nr:hypothetical protein HQ394_05120 [Defluviicoccus vanus]
MGAKVNAKQRLIREALVNDCDGRELWWRLADCGTDRRRCSSPFCIKCFNRYVEGQTLLMKRLFDRYPTEVDQRQNIRFLTILFDAYTFDLHAARYPVFPLERTRLAIKYARNEIQALKRRFPTLKIVGALELDVLDSIARNLRKDAGTIETLLNEGLVRDTRSFYEVLIQPFHTRGWEDHVLLLHGHLVVGLDGVDDRAFRRWCHGRWGKNCPNKPIRRGVHITSLRSNRTIEESLNILARYPLKTPFHYHVPRDAKGRLVADKRPLEDPILAAMVVGRSLLGIRETRVTGRL